MKNKINVIASIICSLIITACVEPPAPSSGGNSSTPPPVEAAHFTELFDVDQYTPIASATLEGIWVFQYDNYTADVTHPDNSTMSVQMDNVFVCELEIISLSLYSMGCIGDEMSLGVIGGGGIRAQQGNVGPVVSGVGSDLNGTYTDFNTMSFQITSISDGDSNTGFTWANQSANVRAVKIAELNSPINLLSAQVEIDSVIADNVNMNAFQVAKKRA